MKKALAGLLITVSLSYGITLQQVIDEALKNSPVLQKKELEVKIEKSKGKELKGKRFGHVDLFVNGVHYEDRRILYPLSPPIDPRRLAGAQNQLIAGISYTVPLFTGFEIEESIKISRINKKIKQLDYRLTKNELVYNIKSIYLKILELEKQKEAVLAYKTSLEQLYSDTQYAVKLGKKPEVDLLKVEYQLASAKAQIVQIQNSISALKTTLLSLVGKEDLDLSKIEEVSLTEENPPSLSQLKEKINRLSTIKKAELAEKIAKRKLKIAKGKYLPSVFLNASAQRNTGNGYYKDLWQVGLQINFTLLDFGSRKGQYIKSKLEVKKTALEKRAVKLEIQKKLADALSKISSAQSKINSAQKQVVFAKKVEEIEKAKYEEGVSDMYDLLYAKAQRITAETSYYQAVYERERAFAYLKYILEEYSDE
ncbi:TolC family protein [Persephonella sp.]